MGNDNRFYVGRCFTGRSISGPQKSPGEGRETEAERSDGGLKQARFAGVVYLYSLGDPVCFTRWTDDTVVQSLYSAILAGYSLRNSDFTKSFTQILNFAPDVVILHFDDHYQTNIAEFLVKIRQTYNQNERPLTLLIVPKDWFDQQLKNLVDMYLTSPVAPDHLLEAIKNLVQQKLP